MISGLLHAGARTNYSTTVTQKVRTLRRQSRCGKTLDPGSFLPTVQRCKHMHQRKRAFEIDETALVCIILRSQAVSMDEKTADSGCLQASDGRLEMR